VGQDVAIPGGWRGRLRGVAAPSGTVTFLFTDIEGSTRLWQADEAAMRAALSRHDDLLRLAIDEHGGVVFSSMGDGFAAAFPAVSAAVRAALGAQKLVEAEAWPTATPIRVRMGLHTGEAAERDGDYYGTAVNVAARLMAAGHGGQVLCSHVTAGLVGREVTLVDLGERRLRDLSVPVRVFQVGGGSFGSLRSVEEPPGHLPSQASSFVGRHAELAAVVAEVGAARLVTLTGVGGVGKTRLALQAAAQIGRDFPDGTWLCELATAGNAEEMVQVVAVALGVVQRPGMTLAASIVDFLRTRRSLVVLDNCEHLIEASAELAEQILVGAPGVRMLVTSREGLGVPGEHAWPVPSLGVSAAIDAAAGDAVVLFTERARAVDPGFVVDGEALEAVVEVCRRLDGIPLAIELAAARVKAMSPAEISAHLDERFRLLTGGRRGRVERHQTLRSALEWSYSLLSDTERVVFDRLGVFPASFDEAAALAVCVGDGVDRWDVIDSLAGLVAKSMVGTERTVEATRYRLLETLRHFARDRAGDRVDGLRRRHAAHYAVFAEQAGAALDGAGELEWRPRVEAELDNLRTATRWASDANNVDDIVLGARVLGGLVREMFLRPSWGLAGWATPALDCVDDLPGEARQAVLAAAVVDAYNSGRLEAAKALGDQVLAEASTTTAAVMVTLLTVGTVVLAGGDPLGAVTLVADGRERCGITADQGWASVMCSFALSMLSSALGDDERTQLEARQALDAARRLRSPTLLVNALAGQANALAATQPEEALAAAEEAIRLVESGAGDQAYTTALQVAATLRASRGDVAEAAHLVRAALRHDERVGNRTELVTFAAVAVALLADRPETMAAAATLDGAIGGPLLGPMWAFVVGNTRHAYERAAGRVTEALGATAAGAARRAGAELSYDEIVAFIIDELPTG